MSDSNYLAEIMLHTSRAMQTELAKIRASFDHSVLKGDGVEDILREFLRKYLPKNVHVGKGEVVDYKGSRSRQCDIVIYNPLRAPTFSSSAGHSVFPAEAVIAVIEVRTRLDASDSLGLVESMKSVKTLDRSGILSPLSKSNSLRMKYHWYGNDYDYPPILYFVFAFESQSLERIQEELYAAQSGQFVDQRIDSVYCLDKGTLMWTTNDGTGISSIPNLSLYWSLVPTQHALLLFYILNFDYLVQTSDIIRFNAKKYSPTAIESGQIRHYPSVSLGESGAVSGGE